MNKIFIFHIVFTLSVFLCSCGGGDNSFNSPPQAHAGVDSSVIVGCSIGLDGSASFDQENDELTYFWSIGSLPVGSSPSFIGHETVQPIFTPDLDGKYVIELKVIDSKGKMDIDYVTITAEPWYRFEHYIYGIGSAPEAVAIGDINKDGKNDVVVTTDFYFDPENDYSFFVFAQNSSGMLSTPYRYQTGYGPISVDVGDVNSDGRNDIVVGSAGDKRLEIYHQNLLGYLDSMITLPTDHAWRIRIGDVTGDGINDIVAVRQMITVYAQNASGGWHSAVDYTMNPSYGNDLELGDVNGDGRLDAIVNARSQLVVLLQNKTGTFDSPVYYEIPRWCEGLGVGDINGDGLEDVALSKMGNRPLSELVVLYQNSDHTLHPPITFPAYDIPIAVEIADIDGDGPKDVVVFHQGWDEVGVFYQNLDGGLDTYTLYPLWTTSQFNQHGMAVGDFSGDGRMDIAMAHSSGFLYTLVQNPPPVCNPLP